MPPINDGRSKRQAWEELVTLEDLRTALKQAGEMGERARMLMNPIDVLIYECAAKMLRIKIRNLTDGTGKVSKRKG